MEVLGRSGIGTDLVYHYPATVASKASIEGYAVTIGEPFYQEMMQLKKVQPTVWMAGSWGIHRYVRITGPAARVAREQAVGTEAFIAYGMIFLIILLSLPGFGQALYCNVGFTPSLPACTGSFSQVNTTLWQRADGVFLTNNATILHRSFESSGNDTLKCKIWKTLGPHDPCDTYCSQNTCPIGQKDAVQVDPAEKCHCWWSSQEVSLHDRASGMRVQKVQAIVGLARAWAGGLHARDLYKGLPIISQSLGQLHYFCPDACILSCFQTDAARLTPVNIGPVGQSKDQNNPDSVPVPEVMTVLGGPTTCDIFSSNAKASVDFDSPKRSGCDFLTDHTTRAFWTTWSCSSTAYKAFVVISLIILSTTALRLIIWVIKPLLYVLRLVLPHSTKYHVVVEPAAEPRPRSKSSAKEEGVAKQPEQLKGSMRWDPVRRKWLPIALLCMFSVAQACDNLQFIANSSPVCFQDGSSLETCSTSYDVALTLADIGSQGCMQLSDGQSGFVGRLVATLLSVEHLSPLTHEYYTSDWFSDATCFRPCGHEGICDSRETCANVDPNDAHIHGQINSEPHVSHPGVSYCHTNCACAACQCFYCDFSCLFCRYVIIPQGEIFEVLSPSTPFVRAKVLLEFEDSSGLKKSEIVPLNEVGSQALGFNLQLTSSISTRDFKLDKKVVLGLASKKAFWAEGTVANSLVPGTIGEVQAATAQNLTSPNPRSFNFAQGLVTVTQSDFQDSYTNKQPAISLLRQSDLLPQVIDGEIFNINSGLLQSEVKQVSPISIRLWTSEPISYRKTVNIVCPVAFLESVSGCHDCPLGFTIMVNAHSSCAAGMVSLTTADESISLVTKSLILRVEPQVLTITGQTSAKVNNFDLIFLVGEKQTLVPVSFVAADYNAVVYIDTNKTVAELASSSGGFNLSGLSLNGLAAGLLFSGAGVLFLILVSVLVYCSCQARAPFAWKKHM